ncbi:unnamed protein product [Rhizoctonia solani]|uniref:Uncharacterized protein n=1 Tax=Rhizoctonia solani TaxID=456999 RepID=A0A8H3EA61_9AGAM|nr:unnamed protein product [Rhizoctonia solani]
MILCHHAFQPTESQAFVGLPCGQSARLRQGDERVPITYKATAGCSDSDTLNTQLPPSIHILIWPIQASTLHLRVANKPGIAFGPRLTLTTLMILKKRAVALVELVEGFSNLALIATFLAGAQAQLLSDTNDESEGALSIATSAAFFGGLIFSVFTAILATLSGRWFSILREDDADYLSSRWLAQDSKRIGDIEGGSRQLGPDLKEYLDFQIRSLQSTRLKKMGIKSRRGTTTNVQPNANTGALLDGPIPRFDSPEPTGVSTDEILNLKDGNMKGSFDPLVFDIECILNLLHKERTGEGIDPSKLDFVPETQEMSRTTWKERALGWALLSPLVVCIPSFVLFAAGIMMLAWDKQPRAVAIFTSAAVLFCVLPLFFFFLEHRHKHVIRHIYLGRASL